jgi:23S rRNA pseudouridine2605 synthase
MIDHVFDPNAPAAPGQDVPGPSGGDGADDSERIAKVLARAGVASRREVERLIAAGRVRLNGKLVDTPAIKIGLGDTLTVDGAVVGAPEPARVWRYHKPAGLVTTHKDPKGRPTVFDHLPAGLPRVISVGRLDLNTEGLLLLTNDGALARALELPATGLARRYRARARGHTTQAKLDGLKDGLTVEGVRYGPIDAKLDKAKEGAAGANLWITLTLREGKNREVRKVLEALGLTVNRLIRLSYGPFQLGTLAAGEVEEVGPRVIREQLGEFISSQNLPSGSSVPAPLSIKSRAGGGAKPAGGARRSGGAAGADEPSKPTYKPGWAKPKKRAVRPNPKPRRDSLGPRALPTPIESIEAGQKGSKSKSWSASRPPVRSHFDGKRPGGPVAQSVRPAREPGSPRSPNPSKRSQRGPPKGSGPKPRG